MLLLTLINTYRHIELLPFAFELHSSGTSSAAACVASRGGGGGGGVASKYCTIAVVDTGMLYVCDNSISRLLRGSGASLLLYS